MKKIRVLVADMQPITPAIGGGRLRLLGLYHQLTPKIDCLYLGSYDWRGEAFRDQQISATLREVIVPLSDEHFSLNEGLREMIGGKQVIDTLFGLLAPLSKDYCERLWREVDHADVVILSHPWVYPLIADRLKGQPLIYDSQNVEGLHQFVAHADDPLSREIKKHVAATEATLAEAADRIFCCSTDDRDLFVQLYGIAPEKTILMPNGVFVEQLKPPAQPRAAAPRLRAVFIGSNYGPNLEAARYIIGKLATAHPDTDFVIAGGVGEDIAVQEAARGQSNVEITGFLSDQQRAEVLWRADFAINPMFSGSGTNIKMFDFMAVALPIVTTPAGGRGIVAPEPSGIFVATADQFSQAVARLTSLGSAERHELGRLNREYVCREFAWEALSVRAGEAIEALQAAVRTQHPGRSTLGPSRARAAVEAESKRIGIISTFDIKCGIASYTEDFVDGLDDINCQAHIFLSDPMHAQRLNDFRRKTSTAWFYDDLYFKHSVIDPAFIIEQAQRRNLSHVNTQYHLGFFDFEQLLRLLDRLRAAQISSSVTLHNSLALSREQLARLGMTGTKVLVHDTAEVERIRKVAEVELLPFGINAPPQNDAVDRFTVGTFGFLRPHKGLFELLRAFDIVRTAEPGARLRAYCAKYPSGDSELESGRCAALIDELGLRDQVTLDTSFRPKEEVLQLLAACDVNILPYHDVNEGSSAAANYCIAARRPLITSRSRIFEPLADVPYRLESLEPGPIALAILGLLRNDKLKAHLQGRIDRLADERRWREVAAHFLDVVAA